MRRLALLFSIGLGTLGLARSAHAADESQIFDKHDRNYESPQHFAFELRLAPYKPNIDSDSALKQTNGQGPYERVFGDSHASKSPPSSTGRSSTSRTSARSGRV